MTLKRYAVSEQIPDEQLTEAYASTCRTIGYVLRNSEPVTAAKWYLRSLRWPAGRVISAKGLVASALRFVSGKREVCSAENASVNR